MFLRTLALSMCLTLMLATCSADPATKNRDLLGSSQTVQIAGQEWLKTYRARPPCSAVLTTACRNDAVYAEGVRLNRVALDANNEAYAQIGKDPAASSTKLAVDAATAAIARFSSYTKEQP